MSGIPAEAMKLCLSGDWTVCCVAEQFPFLASHLAHLDAFTPDGGPPPQSRLMPEINLTGITALDACGCQLLAQFSRALQQRGTPPRILNIPEEFVPMIHLLGFDREFTHLSRGKA